MKMLVRLLLCCVLATGVWAQRGGGARGGGGGGHMGGGGFHGGGGISHGGGGFVSGGFRGGGGFSHGGGFVGGGFRGGGFNHGFFGGGFGRGFNHGFGRGFGFGFYGGYWPWYGAGYWDPYWYGGYGYPYSYPYYDPYSYSSYYDSGYYSNPNVTVVYPQTQAAPVVTAPARPVINEYRNEYGESREITYLIAFKDGNIRAAAAYWVDGNTLHYVTRQHQERTAPLDSVDRAFSEKLNRDQRVPFHLQ